MQYNISDRVIIRFDTILGVNGKLFAHNSNYWGRPFLDLECFIIGKNALSTDPYVPYIIHIDAKHHEISHDRLKIPWENLLSKEISIFGIPKKYHGSVWFGLQPTQINAILKKISNISIACLHCKEFNHWAQPNRSDGTFLCYRCRTDYSWKYASI